MSLDAEPARPLTSREIAKLFSGLIGSLAGWCEPAEIALALDHLTEHRASYVEMAEAIYKATESER